MTSPVVFLCLALLLPLAAEARTKRSQSAKIEFKHEHPCPATGARKGPCKGYVIDHRIGLCMGGSDTADNMRWMTVDAAKAKDRWECRPGWQDKLDDCERREVCGFE